MAREMTPQERAAAMVEQMLVFIEKTSRRKLSFSAIVDMNTGKTENPQDRLVAAVMKYDQATRRAALLEAAQRAGLGECNSLLDAPCLWCGYNGEGYWQPTTHELTCPWHNVGGRFDRVVALDRLAQEG